MSQTPVPPHFSSVEKATRYFELMYGLPPHRARESGEDAYRTYHPTADELAERRRAWGEQR